jgi:O-antigen ligase
VSRVAEPASSPTVVRTGLSMGVATLDRFAPGLVALAALSMLGVAGGAYLPRSWRLSVFAFLALAAAALVSRRQVVLGRPERWFVGGLILLTAWTAASTVWSTDPTTSWLEAERDLVYVAGALVVFVITARSSVQQLLVGAASGVTAVSAYGLGTYLFLGHPLNPIEGKLLFEPIGYANGFGIYTAVGIVLVLGLAISAARPPAYLLALAALSVLVPTLYLTGSRGAWLAAGAGLIVVTGLQRKELPWPIVAASGLLVVAAAAIAFSANGGFVSSFAGDNRPHYWHVAWKEYESNPVFGSGAGTFDQYWLRSRPTSFARDAHSLYLETLAELGPVGLAVLLATLALPLLGLRRRRDPVAAAAAAGYVAFLVHAAVDWDWELPAVTLAGLFCGAALLAAARVPDDPEVAGRGRATLVAGVLALCIFALFRFETGRALPFGP